MVHAGQALKYAGGTTVKTIMQPYDLHGNMTEPTVELEQNGELWGYLTLSAVCEIERQEAAEIPTRVDDEKVGTLNRVEHDGVGDNDGFYELVIKFRSRKTTPEIAQDFLNNLPHDKT